jgi:hypothetical protein
MNFNTNRKYRSGMAMAPQLEAAEAGLEVLQAEPMNMSTFTPLLPVPNLPLRKQTDRDRVVNLNARRKAATLTYRRIH